MLAFSFCSEIRHIAYKEKKVLKKKGMVSMGNRLLDLGFKAGILGYRITEDSRLKS